MAVHPIDNQAFDLSGEDAIYCRNGKRYYQMFPRGECTEFEMRLSPETDLELFVKPYFENLQVGQGWEFNVAQLVNNTVILPPSGYIEQEVTSLEVGAYYRVCLEITEIGSIGVMAATLSGTSVFNGQNVFNKAGIHCVYFTALDTDITITFANISTSGKITLNSASLKQISIPEPSIETCTGTPVGNIDFTIELHADFAKVGICWEQLQPNCFKLCVAPAPDTGEDLFSGQNLITTEDGRPVTVAVRAAGVSSVRAFLTWVA